MAPRKALTPAKVQERAETPPSSPSVDGEIDSPIAAKVAPTPTPRKSAPKRAKTVATFRELTATGPGVTPVVVFYDGQNANAKLNSDGKFSHSIRLHAAQTFQILTTATIDEGEYAGCQGVIIKPSAPFKFMQLPAEVRYMIYSYYLSSPEDESDRITIGKGKSHVKAPDYKKGQKQRLALLRVCKTISSEASPLLYERPFKFEDTNLLLNFIAMMSEKTLSLITRIEVEIYKRSCSSSLFNLLAHCPNLQRMHISSGVGLASTPQKAAKTFYGDARRLIDVLGRQRNSPSAFLDVIRFGRSDKCFSIKDGDDLRAWNQEERQEFLDLLEAEATK